MAFETISFLTAVMCFFYSRTGLEGYYQLGTWRGRGRGRERGRRRGRGRGKNAVHVCVLVATILSL